MSRSGTVNYRKGGIDSDPPGDMPSLSGPAHVFLNYLLRMQMVSQNDVAEFAKNLGPEALTTPEQLGRALVKNGMMTDYQLGRVLAGTIYGLMVGNYRVLDRLGAGSMGIVFKGEHIFLKRRIALKVLPMDDDCHPSFLDRFYAEIRVQAELNHHNIVAAYDAGKHVPAAPGLPTLLYLAMELVDGSDLEQYLFTHGRVPIGLACNWIRQVACGLQQAHDRQLIHRDIKPSNMLLTREGQVKLSDFGLVRQFTSRLTDPNALLGTIQFMAPEQSLDPTNISSAADIYGLGASLFWLITGEPPYAQGQKMSEALNNLQRSAPRSLRSICPDAPKELDALLKRLLDRDPTRRLPLAANVMKALEPFAREEQVNPPPAGRVGPR
jgi:serine/threonine protein kinase